MAHLKPLIKKFGFREILTECSMRDWELPFASEITGNDLEHNVIWVRDLPPLLEDRETHAMVYIIDKGTLEVCNKSFMHNIIVLKTKG